MTPRTDEPSPVVTEVGPRAHGAPLVTYRRAAECFWRRAAGVVVVLTLDNELALRLEGPAAMLWEALDEPATLEELVDVLAGLYGSDPEVVRPVIAASLDDLCDRCVVVLDRETCPA